MKEHKPMSEVLAEVTGQVCYRCEKNFAPRKLNGLCDECAATPQPKQEPAHPYWCDCEACEQTTAAINPAATVAGEEKTK